VKPVKSQSSTSSCHRTFKRVIIYNQDYESPALVSLVEAPDEWLADACERLLKVDSGSTVGIVNLDNRQLVVKRYNVKGIWHGVRRALRKTRALISWQSAHLLLAHGIATPRPVAVIEHRFGPIRLKSYFISEYVEGELCRHFFASSNVSEASRKKVVGEIMQIFHRLAEAGISHGDMKATNIIIHKDSPILTDLDALRVHRSRRKHRQAFVKDVQRFLRNWEDQPDLMDIFRSELEAISPRRGL